MQNHRALSLASLASLVVVFGAAACSSSGNGTPGTTTGLVAPAPDTSSAAPVPVPVPNLDAGTPLPWTRTVVAYPMDDVLRMNDVQSMGTHNSYHVARPDNDTKEWAYTDRPLDQQLDQLGVRQIELDVNFRADLSGFDVFHVAKFDPLSTCATFQDCLRIIATWSAAHPGHEPIYIQIEPKSGFYADQADAFFGRLEAEILGVFVRERIITPDEVRGSFATLREAIADHGWPTLGEARGRVFFGLDNASDPRAAYTRGGTSLDGRLIFADSDTTDSYGAFMVANSPVTDAAKIARGVAAHFLVRTMADDENVEASKNDRTRQIAALASGANYISTDYPEAAPPLVYSFVIPDGKPARCNPVSAAATCTTLAIEAPSLLVAQ